METTEQTQEGGLVISVVNEQISKTPQILNENIASVANAKAKVDELLQAKATNGMSESLYNQMLEIIPRLKQTIGKLSEKRKPITSLMDHVKSKFTSLESEIKTMTETLKTACDAYATQIKLEQERIAREEMLTLEKEKEEVDIIAKIGKQYMECFNSIVAAKKQAMANIINSATLENIDACQQQIESFNCYINFHSEIKQTSPIIAKYHTKQEIEAFIFDYDSEPLFIQMQNSLEKDIRVQEKMLIDTISSKKTQLEEAKKAEDARLLAIEEAKKAKDEKEKAAAAEALKIAQQKQEELKKQEAERILAETANIEKTQSESNNASAGLIETKSAETKIEKVAAVQASLFGAAPVTIKAKKIYEITVLKPEAYAAIFQFWFENEGRNLENSKILSSSIEKMVKYAEKKAADDSVFIDSANIKYNEKYKSK